MGAEAVKQDMLGESRIEDLQDAYTRGRSFDSVQADDVRDAVKSVEKVLVSRWKKVSEIK